MRLFLAALLQVLSLAAQQIQFTQVASALGDPTDIESAHDGSGRLFVVRQTGIIRVLRNGTPLAQPFLDITSKTRLDGERGLLGLAFAPGYAQNGRFYVDYTDLKGDTVIAQYRVSTNPDVADATSEIILLHITQPFANHNGGQVRFGPDGYLYIGMGDGGSGGDPMGNGQNLASLLGKLLRVDVESAPGQVRIPPDNPFVNWPGARPEIWAYGLRNPWRFSFDSVTDDLWIGDVGQDAYEEVDFQPAGSAGGQNYGWNLMEGLHCFRAGCNPQGLALPVAEYTHADGCSITGGFVYRGHGSPGLRGTYLYGDFCGGSVWGVTRQGGAFTSRKLAASGFSITTFGQDEDGELYVAAGNGNIYHITGSAAPVIMPGSIVNPASFVAGLTPGSLATAFAAGVLDSPGIVTAPRLPLSDTLDGVSVTVNGTAAPILAIANQNGREQVNFQVPFEVTGPSTASVVMTRDGAASAAVSVLLLEVQPAIFTSNGNDAVVVHNADYTLVTAAHPLVRGEYGFLYAAGLGRVLNQPKTGAAAPSSPLAQTQAVIQVTLGGVPCDVQYAGLAPGFAGVYQVNFQVPAEVATGAGDLTVATAGTVSPAVKVAIQ